MVRRAGVGKSNDVITRRYMGFYNEVYISVLVFLVLEPGRKRCEWIPHSSIDPVRRLGILYCKLANW